MELWERPVETLRREVRVMSAHLPRVIGREKYEREIRLREEEIARRSSPVRAEIADLKRVWNDLTGAERLELAAWISAQADQAFNLLPGSSRLKLPVTFPVNPSLQSQRE